MKCFFFSAIACVAFFLPAARADITLIGYPDTGCAKAESGRVTHGPYVNCVK